MKRQLKRWIMRKFYAHEARVKLVLRVWVQDRFSTSSHVAIHKIKVNRKGTVVTLWTSRPGILIGRMGKDLQDMERSLEQAMGHPVKVSIQEFNPFGYYV